MGQLNTELKRVEENTLEGRRVLHLVRSFKPYLIVFTASACGLIIEIVAARILAPSIGVSLYTWSSIIGVVLAGISIGNYAGGRLVDRFPSPTTLGFILLASGIFTLSVLPLVDPVSEVVRTLPLIPRTVLMTSTLFFLPSLTLGMVSPVVIKLKLRDLDHTGNVVGKIYALSTAGAIFGTFITGFVLIQWIGTRLIILSVAVVLLLMALAFGNLWRVKTPAFACLVLFLSVSGLTIANGALDSKSLRESNYFSIRVADTVVNGHSVKALYLDALVHSYVNLGDPTFLVYNYEEIFADITTYMAQRNPDLRLLFIGGGGYTMPRYFEEMYPQSTLEVIEIDPEVTRVAFDYLALSLDTRIVTYNEDARMAVPKLPEGQYDLVFGDAFNDLSIPYHLTTMEFNEQIRVLLKDNGIYAVNVVDKLHSGRFLRAYVNTLQQTFPYVYVIRDSPLWEDDSRKPQVVVGSFQPLSSAALRGEANTQAGRSRLFSYITPEDTLAAWLNARENILLTDDYAPVDNLMAPIHLEKDALSEPVEHFNAGRELVSQGKLNEAIIEFTKVIAFDPNLARVYYYRGAAYAGKGEYDQAIADFTEAIEIDPEYADVYVNRGLAYKAQGKKADAIADLVKFITLTDNQQWALMVRQQIEELEK